MESKIVFKLRSNSKDIDFKGIMEKPTQDYLDNRSAIWIRRKSITSIAWLLIWLAIFVFIATIGDADYLVVILLLIGIGLLSSTTVLGQKAILSEIQNSPIRSGETEFCLSEDGVFSSHSACKTQISWEFVSGVEVSADSLLLCFGKYDRIPISRTAFVDSVHFDEVFRQCQIWSTKSCAT